MCRHVGYVGAPVMLAEILLDAPHALVAQSYAPRTQLRGRMNADGWGVAWWPVPGAAGAPIGSLHGGGPIWADPNVVGVARAVAAGAFVAAVRSATVGLPGGPESAAPFVFGPLGLAASHNGSVDRFAELKRPLRAELSDDAHAWVRGGTDAETVVALIVDRVVAGATLADATFDALDVVAEVVRGAGVTAGLNLLVGDGTQLVATRFAVDRPAQETLSVRIYDDAASAASEPWDDHPGWTMLPESSMCVLTPGRESPIIAL